VYRLAKWMVVSTVALGSMAQAKTSEPQAPNGNCVQQLPPAEYQKLKLHNFNLICAGDSGESAGAHKSIAVSHLPTGRTTPPPPKPVPPPPVHTLPPVTHSPPPPQPPVTQQPPPVQPPPVVKQPPPPPVNNPPPPVQPPPFIGPPAPTAAPEIDASLGVSGLALLMGGLLVMRGRRLRGIS
jgi:hypothetical protein